MCIPNIKFLCLTLCQGEVCTDDEANNGTNDNANDDGQFMIVSGSLVDKPNEPKTPLQSDLQLISQKFAMSIQVYDIVFHSIYPMLLQ